MKEGPVYRSLNLRPLVWIGEISYSLYIWQQLFLMRPSGHSLFGRFGEFPFGLAFAFLAAACSFYLIERPAVAFGRNLYARSKAKTIVAE
jgi:peptidoglycan/LPS O-acetylase OafA/YrhL